MKIQAISTTLQADLFNDGELLKLFYTVIVPELIRLDTEDYCCFIDIYPSESTKFPQVIIHDGGKYTENDLEEPIYLNYVKIYCSYEISTTIKLYVDIHDGIICYLSER